MATSLRGELTRYSCSAPSDPASIERTLENIQHVLSKFVRLTQPAPAPEPQITLTSDTPIEPAARDAIAPWTWTAGEVTTTEAVLIPFLIHLAAARNDVIDMRFCIDTYSGKDGTEESHKALNIAGGVVNCPDPTNGQTPLHAACLNGCVQAVDLLLRSGALVHLRDTLGHTALYYVRVASFLILTLVLICTTVSRPLDKVMKSLLINSSRLALPLEVPMSHLPSSR